MYCCSEMSIANSVASRSTRSKAEPTVTSSDDGEVSPAVGHIYCAWNQGRVCAFVRYVLCIHQPEVVLSVEEKARADLPFLFRQLPSFCFCALFKLNRPPPTLVNL